METKRPSVTASLKERIKRNKILTFSPKTGSLVGVNPNPRRQLDGFMDLRNAQNKGDAHLAVTAKQFLTARGSATTGGKLSIGFEKGRVRFAGQSSRENFLAKTCRNTQSGNSQRGYSTNQAFNLTYNTAKDPVGEAGRSSIEHLMRA